ncbi:MAG: efflux RND transporter periplasmic adaptor subunit [Rickettsiales bacterium]|nr:efflux RND transporter periplasmic adaptor subunit [Rickettsiales bacterium]
MHFLSFLIFSSLILSIFSTNAFAQNATPVVVIRAEKQSFTDEVEALGTLQANESVDLTATVTELVTAVNFEDNQRVIKGDILLEMDTAEEQAMLLEEQSKLREAKRQFERVEKLVKRGASSQALFDQAKRDYETAKARIKAIESRLHERQIAAPFDGVVGIREISVGALAQPGKIITTIDDDTIMKLDFSVPAVHLASLKEGIQIEAGSKAFDGRVFRGTIHSIDSRIDPVTRAIQVRALLQNPDRLLKPGLLMRVKLKKDPRDTLLVPEGAIVTWDTQHYVFVVDDATAKRVPVEIGSRRAGWVEIVDGVQVGDALVTHGTVRINDGAHVNVVARDDNQRPITELLRHRSRK